LSAGTAPRQWQSLRLRFLSSNFNNQYNGLLAFVEGRPAGPTIRRFPEPSVETRTSNGSASSKIRRPAVTPGVGGLRLLSRAPALAPDRTPRRPHRLCSLTYLARAARRVERSRATTAGSLTAMSEPARLRITVCYANARAPRLEFTGLCSNHAGNETAPKARCSAGVARTRWRPTG